jgi:hypothetical protein
MTEEQWLGFYHVAALAMGTRTAPGPVTSPVKGRFIAVLVDRVCKFWADHRATLIPYLTQLAIAALDALLSAQIDIHNVDPPGPA